MKSKTTERFLRVCVLLLLAAAVPVSVWGQKKTDKPAPPPKAAAAPKTPAAKTPTNPQGHPGTTGGTGTGNSTMGRPGTTTNGRPGTMTNGRPGTMTNGRTGSNMGNKAAGTNMGGKTGGTMGGASNGNRGGMTTGRAAMNRTPPGRQVTLKGGGSASIRPNGQIRSINRNGMQIQHGLSGRRTIVSTRNGARIVTRGPRGGYVQRAYVTRGGHAYYSRTYYYHGAYRTGVYRGYYYGGRPYYGYYPPYYYHPAYYGWAYNPWPAPVYYGWGWAGQPWYGYYGPYYQPYPVYPSAAFWLTDWLIAANLRAAYEAQAAAGAKLSPLGPDFPLVASLGMMPLPEDTSVAMSKAVKDMLAEEVKAQLAEDQTDAGKSGSSSGAQAGGQAASNEPPPVLDPKRTVYVVSDELSITADGQECALTAGDIIQRVSDKPDDDGDLDVKVLAAKKADCAVGKQGSVSLDDLQEMHNHFREQMTGGMDELSKKQGTGGLPKAPDTGTQAGDVPPPPPDKSAAKTLEDQESSADQTETQVKQEAGSSGGGGGGR